MRPDDASRNARDPRPVVLYLHGFNSSPQSQKARQFKAYFEANSDAEVLVPALPHHPREAITQLRELLGQRQPGLITGSSLGGFYATVLAEESGCRAALVNPAVAPQRHLGEAFLGRQRNLYTGEEYEFTRDHAEALEALTPEVLQHPGRFLVLLQSGDEVLDYRHALAFYTGSRVELREGGSHAFEDFGSVLPLILAFAELE